MLSWPLETDETVDEEEDEEAGADDEKESTASYPTLEKKG